MVRTNMKRTNMKRTNMKRTNKKRTNKKRTRRNKRVHKSRRNKRVHKLKRNKRVHKLKRTIRVQKLKRTNGIRQIGGINLTLKQNEHITRDPDYQIFNLPTQAINLEFEEKIAEGGNGSVHKGLLYPATDKEKKVAIKLYNSESNWYNSYLQFKETKDITFKKVNGGPDLKVNNTLKFARVIPDSDDDPIGERGEKGECSIMELYEGKDLLEEMLGRSKNPDLSEIKIWAGQILRQLIELHKVCGHGDIKPENIAIEIEAEGGKYLRLIDFDKFEGGTETYNAPELREVMAGAKTKAKTEVEREVYLRSIVTQHGFLQRCDMYSFGMTMLMVCRVGVILTRAQIPAGFSGDHAFMEVITNLLSERMLPTDRYTADQAYDILFPDGVVPLWVEPEPVKCPFCQQEVNVSEIQGQEGYQKCEKCRQYDDTAWY